MKKSQTHFIPREIFALRMGDLWLMYGQNVQRIERKINIIVKPEASSNHFESKITY